MSEATSERVGACTIVSPNYLSFARTLSESYLNEHAGHRFFVLFVADLRDASLFADAGVGDRFTPVSVYEIGLADVRGEAMKYDILELNTNVKPSFLKYLLRQYGLEKLVYLDPDIFVYSPLTPVFAALDGCDAVLTPHLTAPIDDDKRPSEQDLLYNGTYNLGFFAVRAGREGERILDWWEARCLASGFSEGRTGLFVDQKWMNLAPGLFERVAILRHPGCNMAYWNLHERTLSESGSGYVVNGTEPLCFFHFSGVVVADATMLSKHTDRYTLPGRPDLHRLFAEYKAAVVARRDAGREGIAYGFDVLTDGTAITRLARRIYAKHQARWAGFDPFEANGEFARFAKGLGLVRGKAKPKTATWKEFDPGDRRVRAVHASLKMALRVLGPDRYEVLMRYLAHISVLRNQSVFLGNLQGRR